MERSSLDEERDCTEIEGIDAFLQADRCKWDTSYSQFDGDPIYDTEDEGFKIAKFWLYEQPNYSVIQEQQHLQVPKRGFNIQDAIESLQL
jgi:hypothetical protein